VNRQNWIRFASHDANAFDKPHHLKFTCKTIYFYILTIHIIKCKIKRRKIPADILQNLFDQMSFRSMPYHRFEILLSVAFDENITFSFWIHETASSILNVTQRRENGTFWPGSLAGAISVFARGTSSRKIFVFFFSSWCHLRSMAVFDLRHCVEILFDRFIRWNFKSNHIKSVYFWNSWDILRILLENP